MKHTLLALLTCLALAAGAVACGDDDEGESDSTNGATGATGVEGDAPTKEEFLAEADRICANVNDEIGAAGDDREAATAAIEQGIDDLGALTPPAGDEEEIAEMLDAARAALDELKGGGGQTGGDPFADFAQLAGDYGIDGGCTEAGEGG